MFLTSPLIDRDLTLIDCNNSSAIRPCCYAEGMRFHQRRISQVSRQRATIQIAAPAKSPARIAVMRAETLNAIAIKNPNDAPMRVRNPRSWYPLARSTAEASNWPPTGFHPAPIVRIEVLTGIGYVSRKNVHTCYLTNSRNPIVPEHRSAMRSRVTGRASAWVENGECLALGACDGSSRNGRIVLLPCANHLLFLGISHVGCGHGVIFPHGDAHIIENGRPIKTIDLLQDLARIFSQGLRLARSGGGRELRNSFAATWCVSHA